MSNEPTGTPAAGDVVPFPGGAVGEALPPLPSPDEPGVELERPAPPADLGDVDPSEAFESKSATEEIYYDESSGRFWVRNEDEVWVDLSEGGLKRHLKKVSGLRDKPAPGKVISPLDEEVSRIEKNSRVAFAGLLAGYRAGVHVVTGRRVLVTEDPLLIEPRPGEWPVLRAFFDGLLVGTEPADDKGGTITIDQRDHFYGWLWHVVQCLREDRTDTGLMLGIAGEPNCGKSFLALILRWLLGGRVGKPYANMIGQDNFNRDGAEAVLQLIDDENQADTKLDMRQKFASEVKKFVANNEFRLRSMHKDGFAVEVLRRLVVLVNRQGIMVLPPLDGDVDDKVMLLKGYARPEPTEPINLDTPYEQACWPAPMPTRTPAERERYRETVQRELPAFLHWLCVEWKMPSHVQGGRFIVRHWHHPAIVAELHELSPHTRLWDLIVRARVVFEQYEIRMDGNHQWVPVPEWKGTAGDLEQLLKKHERSQLSQEEKKEIPSANWLGRRLQLCARHFGKGVADLEPRADGKFWTLRPRPQDRKAAKT